MKCCLSTRNPSRILSTRMKNDWFVDFKTGVEILSTEKWPKKMEKIPENS